MKRRNLYYRIMRRVFGEQGREQVITRFINDNQFKSYVEIGVWKGETVEYVIKNTEIKEVYIIDPYDENLKYGKGKISSADYTELSKAKEQMLKRMKPLEKKVKIHYLFMTSEEAAKLFVYNKFDMIFIDGNHQYDYVKRDVIDWLPLLKDNGILAGHDYNNRWKNDVVKAVDEMLDIELEDDAVWYYQKDKEELKWMKTSFGQQ